MPQDVDLNQTVVESAEMLGRLIREDIDARLRARAGAGAVKRSDADRAGDPQSRAERARRAAGGRPASRLEVARRARRSQSTRRRTMRDAGRLRAAARESTTASAFRPRRARICSSRSSRRRSSARAPGSVSRPSTASCGRATASSRSRASRATARRSRCTFRPSPASASSARRRRVAAAASRRGRRDDSARRRRGRGPRRSSARCCGGRATTCSRRRPRARACDIFERHAREIDLLLTDVVMPEMNGPALAQRLVSHPARAARPVHLGVRRHDDTAGVRQPERELPQQTVPGVGPERTRPADAVAARPSSIRALMGAVCARGCAGTAHRTIAVGVVTESNSQDVQSVTEPWTVARS